MCYVCVERKQERRIITIKRDCYIIEWINNNYKRFAIMHKFLYKDDMIICEIKEHARIIYAKTNEID